MRKVLVIQHVAYEIYGTLNPLLKKSGLRIRYVNFDREPDAYPSVERYDGLIILGGYMGVYQVDKYAHLKVEMNLIDQALKKSIPILGICLGSQILAHVLGAHVRKHTDREMGWYDVHLTENGAKDLLLRHFKKTERVFQSHGDTFDIPKTAEHLAWSELCPGQAFRYGDKVYGLQFHLETDRAIVDRWLDTPVNRQIFRTSRGKFEVEKIKADTASYLDRSVELSIETFSQFIKLFGEIERNVVLGSR
jgi:GMP synthase (glutamine-hydrolysing)